MRARYQQEAIETQNAELLRQKLWLERLQSEIIQNEKMASLGQMAAGVAHELNNPVGFVYANLELLDTYLRSLSRLVRYYDDVELAPRAAAEIADIKTETGYPLMLDDISSMILDCREGSERIRKIVQNLSTFSRLDQAEYSQTNILEGIDSTIRLLPQYFSAGNIHLIRHYAEVPLIGAFSSSLNQVWMNLLVNAAQAIGPSKGQVVIESRFDDENVFIKISDSGDGIAVQDLDRIFDPFYTTKPTGEGTGLGLSISFGIVERHGGSITVSSQLMEGTTFEVRLPRFFAPDTADETKSVVPYRKTDQVNYIYETQNTTR
jgi:signal transduction histidine kinase